jgi:hypothetical protein
MRNMTDLTHLDLISALESALSSGTLDDRAAFTVLNRPLALTNGTAASYLERRASDHPRQAGSPSSGGLTPVPDALQQILHPTFGLLLYREQTLALASAVCAFDSNELRRLWLHTAKLTVGPEADDFGRAFVNRRHSPWTSNEASRVWRMIVDAAPIVMAAGDAYRAAARRMADERVNEVWPMLLNT